MSYAGEYREYPRRCSWNKHQWIPRGDCHICGCYRDNLIKEALMIVKECLPHLLKKVAFK